MNNTKNQNKIKYTEKQSKIKNTQKKFTNNHKKVPQTNKNKQKLNKKTIKPIKKTKQITKQKTTKKISKTHKITKKYLKSSKKNNKNAHIKNGNFTFKMLTWNKGNSKMTNKVDTISAMISEHKPKIVALQEVNFTVTQDLCDIQIPGYRLELDQQHAKHGRSRSCIYIHESLKYTRRLDLESDEETHVWITLHFPGGKNMNVQCLYRQWQKMGPTHAIPDTNTPQQQLYRFNEMSNKWQIAMAEHPTMSLSDTNVNTNTIDMSPQNMHIQDRKQIPIMRALQDKILNNGACIIKTDNTRYNWLTKMKIQLTI